MYTEDAFTQRLTELRLQKGVSARDMSLSLGQGPAYINNIENGHYLPSMNLFFCICDYLSITPSDFFDTANSTPETYSHLCELIKKLPIDKQNALIELIK